MMETTGLCNISGTVVRGSDFTVSSLEAQRNRTTLIRSPLEIGMLRQRMSYTTRRTFTVSIPPGALNPVPLVQILPTDSGTDDTTGISARPLETLETKADSEQDNPQARVLRDRHLVALTCFK